MTSVAFSQGGEPASKVEEAYWRLREEIVAGRLGPSQKLRIDYLRKLYGFGASGLREALSRLASEGLVEAEAQRGFWVAPISREELKDITLARSVIEVEALRQSILHGTLEWEGRVVAVRHSLEHFEQSMIRPSAQVIAGWERANRQFHMGLISGCPSRWLLRFTESLYDQSQRYRHRTVLRRTIPRQGLSPEHIKLVEATLARDAERACAILRAHIENTARVVELSVFGIAGEENKVKRLRKTQRPRRP